MREEVIAGTPNLDAAVSSSRTRDDRVLSATRVVAYVIVPFLVLAFAVLYPLPDVTGRLFAWHIQPTLTAMLLGSAYLGGAYFCLCAGRAKAAKALLVRGLVKPAVEGG